MAGLISTGIGLASAWYRPGNDRGKSAGGRATWFDGPAVSKEGDRRSGSSPPAVIEIAANSSNPATTILMRYARPGRAGLVLRHACGTKENMGDPPTTAEGQPDGLQRHFGLLHATALNVTMIVGAGVFITIPFMLGKLPGPYALLGWLAAGALMIIDGQIWSELGATLPGSGGSYRYLLESYGPNRWGRPMAFLFVWQFLISGPLEIATGFIAIATFLNALNPDLPGEVKWTFWPQADLSITVGPMRLVAFGLGILILVLLYRRITALARLTVTFWLGVLAVIVWILVEGALHFNPAVAFDFSGAAAGRPADFWTGLGAAMILAMYSYLGYYNVCYVGDEVRDPGRTIPRAILLSSVLVCVLFVALHLAMLGTVPWDHVTRAIEQDPNKYSLAADFMGRIHDRWAVVLVTLLLVWSCFGSAFAGLLGYSRIPYGAAHYGHFFASLGRIHPRHRIPHVSLLLVGGLTLFWSFFDLQNVITALITTRILEQFIGQTVGVMLLRRRRPDLPRPYRIWLYPLPCGLALAGWLYVYWASGLVFIVLGLATLLVGVVIFLGWSRRTRQWPFAQT
jgi:amino acid transporter